MLILFSWPVLIAYPVYHVPSGGSPSRRVSTYCLGFIPYWQAARGDHDQSRSQRPHSPKPPKQKERPNGRSL